MAKLNTYSTSMHVKHLRLHQDDVMHLSLLSMALHYLYTKLLLAHLDHFYGYKLRIALHQLRDINVELQDTNSSEKKSKN